MAWYDGTYSCGHEGRTNIIGPTKNRQWIADRHFEKMCPECWEEHKEKEKERLNKEAAEKAIEMELPSLTGTEKQVVWANTLRQQLIESVQKAIDRAKERYTEEKHQERLNEVIKINTETLNYILSTRTEARWHIDNRAISAEEMLRNANAEIEKIKIDSTPEAKAVIEEEKTIKEQSIVMPENYSTTVPVEIIVSETDIKVKSEKNDRIINICKNLGYEWTAPVWSRKINKFNGPAEGRAAELGNKLLNAGFPIIVLNPIIRQNAIEGKYEPECKRWLSLRTSGEYSGWLCIQWEGDNDRIYKAAKSLPGARWSSPSVVVRAEHHKECLDFAEMFGFKVSDGAEKVIGEQKQKEESALKVKPAKANESKPATDGLKEILKSGDEIPEDLKDDNKSITFCEMHKPSGCAECPNRRVCKKSEVLDDLED